MKLNQFEDFAAITLSTYNLKDIAIDYQKALTALTAETASEYEELNSEKVLVSRCEFYKIPDVEKEHYQEYMVSITDKGKVICGIRHLNMQPDAAFINILTNFKTSQKELLDIYQTYLHKYFELFKPKYLRYYTNNKILSDIRNNCYLVQMASVIKEKIIFEEEKNMTLITPINESYYKDYQNEYEKFHQKYPDLKNKVPCNDLKLMENSRKDGLLKEVKYQGKSIGLIAGLRDDFLGHPAIYFIEILLKENWRGKGLAKAMQRKYINEISAANEIVWGTIDMANQPSIMTAKANLRKAVRYENFVKID